MANGENNYGLSEGVYQACQFLGLNFPLTPLDKFQPMPSDYFGEDFEFNAAVTARLKVERNWSNEKFDKVYKLFEEKFLTQEPLKHTKTDLNVYFCDYALFSTAQTGASPSDYFDFEFYRKPAVVQRQFLTQRHRNRILKTCSNVFSDILLIDNKIKTNKLFSEFLHREWLDVGESTLEEFKAFVEKYPRFFSKPFNGSFGKGAEIIEVDLETNVEELFEELQNKKSLVEEVVTQHLLLQEFCADTVNTIRVNTFLDVHNVVHILTTSGRFGRAGNVVDNFHGGGYCVNIDPDSGLITSDAINKNHERVQRHPDSGKAFKGFRYPYWDNLRVEVVKMAKKIPQIPHVGWDLAINDKGEAVLIEANNNPDVDVQQAADSIGRFYLYRPLVEEVSNYKQEQLRALGYRVNDIHNFDSSYDPQESRHNLRLRYAMDKLVPDCLSLMDLGCRKEKPARLLCPSKVKYYPVDFRKHDDEVFVCDFNSEDLPNLKADTILCAFTAEYVERLPRFLANMCNAAQKQILMWCRPFDKETAPYYRWRHAFLVDFTEKFLIDSMSRNNFKLVAQYHAADNRSVILYDFRKTI